MTIERSTRAGLGVLDGVASVGLAMVLFGIAAVQLVVVPSFGAMFADFGGELPDVTRAVMRPLIAAAGATAILALAAPALLVRAVSSHRALRALAALALGLAVALGPVTLGVMFWALYAPIYALAGAIR